MRLLMMAGLGVAVALLGAACSQAASAPRPALAEPELAGTYQVSALRAGGKAVTLSMPVEIELDANHSQITVSGSCNTGLGAFTLAADGRASVTVAGGSQLECAAPITEQEALVLETLAAVNSWSETADGLVLVTVDGDEMELSR